jgi:hypothetical protein
LYVDKTLLASITNNLAAALILASLLLQTPSIAANVVLLGLQVRSRVFHLQLTQLPPTSWCDSCSNAAAGRGQSLLGN